MTTHADGPEFVEPAVETVAEQRDDGDLLDDDWAPQRRTNRLTVALVVAIVAASGFIGGALVQRETAGSEGSPGLDGQLFPGGGLQPGLVGAP